GPAQRIEFTKQLSLDFKTFSSSFDDEVAFGERRAGGAGPDALQSSFAGFARELLLGDFAVEILGDSGDAAIEKRLLHIAEHHVETLTRENVGDAVAHGSG